MAGTELATIETKVKRLDELMTQASGGKLLRGTTSVTEAISRAKMIDEIRSLLTTEVMAPIMALQGSPLGFVTDKDASGVYPSEVVRNVMVETLMRGLRMTDNEVNIIAGRMYAAKNGFRRLVKEYEGLTDDDLRLEVPAAASETTALVAVTFNFKLNGTAYSWSWRDNRPAGGGDERIPVRVNAGMGPDAVLGKAERKAYKRIYEKLTGITMPEAEDELPPNTIVGTATPVTSRSEQLASQARPAKQEQPLTNPAKPASGTRKTQMFDDLPDAQPPSGSSAYGG